MSNHTTFKTGGPAKVLVCPKDKTQLKKIIKLCMDYKENYYIIGRGSNLLVADEGIDGVVIKICQAMDEVLFANELLDKYRRDCTDVAAEEVQVFAGAGIMLSKLANILLDKGLKGFEFASGIPGTLGGAVTMNAGAYGGELRDVVKKVYAIDEQGNDYEFSADEMNFSYRHSIIMDRKLIVTGVILGFMPGDKASIKEKMDDFNGRRRDKQPLEFPSAGSTFKRPEGYFAGKLIEDCGLRGARIGGASVSTKHCGFVINDNNATSTDIYQLMQHIDKVVYEKFGVHLEPEVRIIGDWRSV